MLLPEANQYYSQNSLAFVNENYLIHNNIQIRQSDHYPNEDVNIDWNSFFDSLTYLSETFSSSNVSVSGLDIHTDYETLMKTFRLLLNNLKTDEKYE